MDLDELRINYKAAAAKVADLEVQKSALEADLLSAKAEQQARHKDLEDHFVEKTARTFGVLRTEAELVGQKLSMGATVAKVAASSWWSSLRAPKEKSEQPANVTAEPAQEVQQ